MSATSTFIMIENEMHGRRPAVRPVNQWIAKLKGKSVEAEVRVCSERAYATGKNMLELFPALTPETSTFYHVLRTGKPLINPLQKLSWQLGHHSWLYYALDKGKIIGFCELYRGYSGAHNLSERIRLLQGEVYKKTPLEKAFHDNRAVYTFQHIVGRRR